MGLGCTNQNKQWQNKQHQGQQHQNHHVKSMMRLPERLLKSVPAMFFTPPESRAQ